MSIGTCNNVMTDSNFKTAVSLWLSNETLAVETYCSISTWDTQAVTDMSNTFFSAYQFDDDISNWNVSSVTNMAGMFEFAREFNQDISNWNVSSVTSMVGMFRGAL